MSYGPWTSNIVSRGIGRTVINGGRGLCSLMKAGANQIKSGDRYSCVSDSSAL